MLSLRVRIVGATILAVAIILFVCTPTSVVDALLASADDLPLSTPPELHTASHDTPISQTAPGSLDALVADLGRDVESPSTMADVDHRVEELIDHLLAGGTTLDIERSDSLSVFDQRGLFDGRYSLQASQCLSCDAADGGLGFAQGGLPFLRGRGGSGGPAIGMRSTSGGGGASGSGGGGLPGSGPTAPDATLEFRPVTDGDDFTVEPVLDTEGGPNPGGDAPWSAPPLTFTEPNTPVDPTPVPEPATIVLTGLGIAGLVARNRGARMRPPSPRHASDCRKH